MNENALVPANTNTGVAAYNPMVETGLEDVARLRPTNLVLVQPATRDARGAHPGQILDALTEQAFDSLTVVPLRIQRQRVLFPPGADLDAEPICRSDDGVVPSQYAGAPQSAKCASCPHAQWLNGQKAACAEKFRVLSIVKDGDLAGLPRWITVGGMSIKSLRPVLERIRQDIAVNQRKGNPLALYDYYFTIKSEKAVSKKGNYYILRFEDVKRVSNASEFGPFFEEFVIKAKNVPDADEEVDNEVGQALPPQSEYQDV